MLVLLNWFPLPSFFKNFFGIRDASLGWGAERKTLVNVLDVKMDDFKD